MRTTRGVETTPVIEAGTEFAGGWRVERVLTEVAGLEAYYAVDGAYGRAICFLLPPDAPDPELDEEAAAAWGTTRCILRDPVLGRIVLDEVPEGPLFADRLAEGWTPGAAFLDPISTVLRREHRRGRWHGQLAPDRVVLGADHVAIAGWGLCDGDASDLRARDLAGLAALSGHADRSRGGVGDAGPGGSDRSVSPSSAALSALCAAMASDHLPTLRAALDRWREDGGDEQVPEYRRALDALERIERKVDEHLEAARLQVERGDPLGAVAACREVVRLGAEDRALPLMKQARRQARDMLGGRRPFVRRAWIVAAGAVGLLLCGLLGWWLMGRGGDSGEIARQAALMARTHGERAVIAWLLDLRVTGESSAETEALLTGHLQALAAQERQKMLELRREIVSQGARPRQADRLAEESLARLDALAAADPLSAGFGTRLTRVLIDVDKAAARYRAGARIDNASALRAVEQLLREDPLFGAAGGEKR
ncbi:MAG: hypothetical protein Q9Q40_07305 [Acidobacteriota bacterium]|nr:hypothetical protein [Acidobacteriota bacterium]